MPAENQQAVPKLDFNTPDAGRSYIAKLFETLLRRHDYRQYISERLAGDFACTLAQHLEEIKAREDALQLLLNERDEQNHSLEQRRHAEQQACQAAERLVDVASSLIQRLVANKDIEIMCYEDVESKDLAHDQVLEEMRSYLASINPITEAASHD